PNMPILVSVEINYDDLLISVKINDFPLEKTGGATWEGIINASSQTGKHVLSVIVSYNDVQCINDSSTYYVVEESVSDFPVGTLLLFFTYNEGFLTKGLTILIPVSAMAIISAIMIWKKRNRQPGFSRDYTLDVGSDSN
ncbi:MAG: hypothetical protein ACETWM_12220, partial [Candidatus Lokiarchaeia archaeon]